MGEQPKIIKMYRNRHFLPLANVFLLHVYDDFALDKELAVEDYLFIEDRECQFLVNVTKYDMPRLLEFKGEIKIIYPIEPDDFARCQLNNYIMNKFAKEPFLLSSIDLVFVEMESSLLSFLYNLHIRDTFTTYFDKIQEMTTSHDLKREIEICKRFGQVVTREQKY